MNGNRPIAVMMSALMALSLITVYPQEAESGVIVREKPAKTEEMTRDFGTAYEVTETKADAEGICTVTITEDMLMFDESFAGMVPEIVTAREAAMAEEMSRGDLDFEFDVVDTDGDGYFEFDDVDAGDYFYEDYFDVDGDFYEETVGDYAEAGFEDGGFDDSYEEAYDGMEDGFAEEGFVEEADEEAGIEEDGFEEDFPMENESESETGAEAESTVESDSSDVTEEKWSLDAVRAEDVSVYFQLPVRSAEGEENGYVIGSSRVAGFQNNNDGSIGLSFACVTGDVNSRIYTIRFAGADAYTAVMVHPADTMAQDAEADSSSEAQNTEADSASEAQNAEALDAEEDSASEAQDAEDDTDSGAQDAETDIDSEEEATEAAIASAAGKASSAGGEQAKTTPKSDADAGTIGETIMIESNDTGRYTVTITEDNLTFDERLAEENPEIVTAEEAGLEEEMTRGDLDFDVPDPDTEEEITAVDAAAYEIPDDDMDEGLLYADEGSDEEFMEDDEDLMSDDAGFDDTIIEDDEEIMSGDSAAEKEDDEKWSLAGVGREDVAVCYNLTGVTDESGNTADVTIPVSVTSFTNDGGTVGITFTDPIAVDLSSRTYTVRFENSDAYAIVATFLVDNFEAEAVDYEAELEADGEGLGFTTDDVALPEGTYIDDGELIVTDAAPEIVQEVLLDSGMAEEEMSRDITPGEGNADGVVEAVPFEDDNGGKGGNGGGGGVTPGEGGFDGPGEEAVPFDGGYNGNGGGNDYYGGVTPGEGEFDGPGVPAEPFEDDNGGGYNGGNNGGNNGGYADAGGNAGGSSGSSSTTGGTSNATLEYLKQYNARQKMFNNFDAVANYSVEILSYVNPTAGKVADYTRDTYNIFKGVYTGNVGSVLQGSMGILRKFGLFKKNPGVTNEQLLDELKNVRVDIQNVMSEVQKVGLEVVDLHCLTSAMNDSVNIIKQELYSQGVEAFDNALIAMEADAEILQRMFAQGAIIADEQGLYVPTEDCTAEEEFDFNALLVELIIAEEAKGGIASQPFRDFQNYVEDLRNNYTLVAGAVAKPEATNPILKYDKYWNTYFNFETQGYYVRQAYRSNIEYQLTRAFSLLEIYYNIFDPRTANTQDTHYENYVKAMEALERMPAGQSPEDIDRSADGLNGNKKFRIYCPTFDCDITDLSVESKMIGCKVLDEQIQEFARRMNGRTLKRELKLAGLWGNGVTGEWRHTFKYEGETYVIGYNGDVLLWEGNKSRYDTSGHGIGFNCRQEGNDFYADFIDANGIVHKDVLTYKWSAAIYSSFDMPPEMPYSYHVPYIFFVMEPHVG